MELGDKKLSQLFNELKQLAGSNVKEEFLLTIWLQRLPIHVRRICASGQGVQKQFSAVADEIMESGNSLVNSISQNNNCNLVNIDKNDCTKIVAEFTSAVQALNNSNKEPDHDPVTIETRTITTQKGRQTNRIHRSKNLTSHQLSTPSQLNQVTVRRLQLNDSNSDGDFLVDTGADISVLPPMSTQNTKPSKIIKWYAANGTPINTYKEKRPTINFGLRRPLHSGY